MKVSEIHRAAVLDNAALCAAMWRAHGLGVESADGCVMCAGTPPRLYPHVVTVDPAIDARVQVRAITERSERILGAVFVKDSYRALALDGAGFEPLFGARWIHRPGGLDAGPTRLDWRPVTGLAELGAWAAAWGAESGAAAGEPPPFTPPFLASPGVTLLAGWAGEAIAAGCIVTTTGAVAGLGNVFGDAPEAIRAALGAVGNRDLVGYETGEALAIALAAGFETIGDLVVWRRPEK